jgi:hypothetical protein
MQWKGWDHGRVEKAPREQAAMMTMMCACLRATSASVAHKQAGNATSPLISMHAQVGHALPSKSSHVAGPLGFVSYGHLWAQGPTCSVHFDDKESFSVWRLLCSR